MRVALISEGPMSIKGNAEDVGRKIREALSVEVGRCTSE
jgi:hypothetical protein